MLSAAIVARPQAVHIRLKERNTKERGAAIADYVIIQAGLNGRRKDHVNTTTAL
jgi:hypothetical protein